MADETLEDLFRQVLGRPAALTLADNSSRPRRPMPRTMRPLPERMQDQNPGVRRQALNQFERSGALTASADRGQAYAPPRNQVLEAGRMTSEATGVAPLARVARDFNTGDPATVAMDAGMGALGVLGTATLGMGGRPAGALRPPVRAPMGRMPTPPPREIGAGGLPIAPARPFRNSFRGGSGDLVAAARLPSSDASNSQGVRLYRGITNGRMDGPYWTTDPRYASRHAMGQGETDGVAVMSADASFRNPYRVQNARESAMIEAPEIGGGRAWIESLRAQGYDAIIDGRGNQVYILDDSRLTPAFGRSGPASNSQGGERWVDLYSGQRGDTNRPWRGHIWTARDRSIAEQYGPNVREMQGDISGAVTIRTMEDLRRALGPRASLAADLRGGDVWKHLDQPEVRAALQEQGVRAVRIVDDEAPIQPTGPGNNWHESYLMLDENSIRSPSPPPKRHKRG